MRDASLRDDLKGRSIRCQVLVEQARSILDGGVVGVSDDEIQALIDDLSAMAK